MSISISELDNYTDPVWKFRFLQKEKNHKAQTRSV